MKPITKKCRSCRSKFKTRFNQRLFCKSRKCFLARANDRTKARAKIPEVRAQRIFYARKYHALPASKRADNLRRKKQRQTLAEVYIRHLLAKESGRFRPSDFSAKQVNERRRIILAERKRRAAL